MNRERLRRYSRKPSPKGVATIDVGELHEAVGEQVTALGRAAKEADRRRERAIELSEDAFEHGWEGLAGHLSQVVEALVEAHAQISAARERAGAGAKALGESLAEAYEELSGAEELTTVAASAMGQAAETGQAAGQHVFAESLEQARDGLIEVASQLKEIGGELESELEGQDREPS